MSLIHLRLSLASCGLILQFAICPQLFAQEANQEKNIKNERLDQRNELLSKLAEVDIKMQTSLNPGEFAKELVPLLEKIVEIDRLIPDVRDEQNKLLRLARIYKTDGQLSKQIQVLKRAVELASIVYQTQPYRITNIKMLLAEAINDSRLSKEKRQALQEVKKVYLAFRTAHYQGKYADALKLTEQICKQYAKTVGVDDPRYITSLNDRAVLLRLNSKIEASAEIMSQVCKKRLAIYGDAHPVYANACRNLASAYALLGDDEAAKRCLERSSKSYLDAHRFEPTELVNRLSLANDVYRLIGDYDGGITQLRKARKSISESFSPNHCDAIRCNAFIGFNLLQSGRYSETRRICQESLEMLDVDRCKGKLRGDLLNNHAMACQNLGFFEEAITDFREALNERKEVFGEGHPLHVQGLNNLAGVYFYLGDYLKARKLYRESLRMLEFDPASLDYATIAVNVANTEMYLENFAEAEKLLLAAKAVLVRSNGASNLNLTHVFSGLSSIAASKGEFDQAIAHLREAKEILNDELGPNNLESVIFDINIANNLAEQGELTSAIGVLTKLKDRIGKSNSQFELNILSQLAVVHQKNGDNGTALEMFYDVLKRTRRKSERTAVLLSPRQQLAMDQLIRHRLDNFVNATLRSSGPPEAAIAAILNWKGSTLRRQRKLSLLLSDAAVAAKRSDLQLVVRKLSHLSQQNPSKNQMERWNTRLAELTEQKEDLETELFRAFGSTTKGATPSQKFASIRESLPDNAVLVDYLECNSSNKGHRFVASIVRRDGSCILLDVGSSETVANLIDQWRKSYGESAASVDAGKKLRKQLWEPLIPHFQNASLILISPDGSLGMLPFAALPGKDSGSYLIEDHRLALLPAPAFLPDSRNKSLGNKLSNGVLLVGDVEYGDPKNGKAENSTRTQWPSLPATHAESTSIADLFRKFGSNQTVSILRKSNATEGTFRKQASNRRFIHVATHGFFATADNLNALQLATIDRSRVMTMNAMENAAGWNPGQLSGLIFAGANVADSPSQRSGAKTANEFSSDFDDGILTADELALLPLSNAELVVLSACETGLGRVAGGEGLLGLQRSLQVAGARSTMASLWKVNDRATQVLMTLFYRNLLEKKMSKVDALRSSQLWMLNHPKEVFSDDGLAKLQDRSIGFDLTVPSESSKELGKALRLSPKFWAAFSISGDWK